MFMLRHIWHLCVSFHLTYLNEEFWRHPPHECSHVILLVQTMAKTFMFNLLCHMNNHVMCIENNLNKGYVRVESMWHKIIFFSGTLLWRNTFLTISTDLKLGNTQSIMLQGNHEALNHLCSNFWHFRLYFLLMFNFCIVVFG